MRKVVEEANGVKWDFRFRCDCDNAIGKIGVSNLEMVRAGQEALARLREVEGVQGVALEKVDQQHTGRGVKDLWQHHTDRRCTDAVKGAMTKFAFFEGVGEKMNDGSLWVLTRAQMRVDDPGATASEARLLVGVCKCAMTKAIGCCFQVWLGGECLTFAGSVTSMDSGV
jgi:hypothetical protein